MAPLGTSMLWSFMEQNIGSLHAILCAVFAAKIVNSSRNSRVISECHHIQGTQRARAKLRSAILNITQDSLQLLFPFKPGNDCDFFVHVVSKYFKFRQPSRKRMIQQTLFWLSEQRPYLKRLHRRLTCMKCEKPHPTVLHNDLKGTKEPRAREASGANSDQGVSYCSSTYHKTSEDKRVTNCLIVPVWLRHKDRPEQEVMV